MNKVRSVIKWVLNSKIRIALVIILVVVAGFVIRQKLTSNPKPTYLTAQVEKGTLVTTVTASGQVTNAGNVQITIQSSGVVKEVLVKNGDSVTQGQTIATLTLDQASQQKATAAYASYLSAKNALDNVNAKYNSLQNTLFVANQKLINDAVARGLKTDDPTYIEENATWLQAEADYKNQATSISAAQNSLVAAFLNLSQLSSNITAPASGVIKGLTITPGAIVTVTSSSSSSTSTSQVLGSVYQQGPVQAQVSISEIDSVSVAPDQKVTMTLDAFPDSTFTGKVVSVNTNGVTFSGVTTYPAVISFDSGNDHIYPNMGISAKIITNIKNDVLLVPSNAVQTSNGELTAKVLKNGQVTSVFVEIGDSNDTQTEITSGLSEADQVVTATVSTSQTSSGQRSSVFGGGEFRMGGGR